MKKAETAIELGHPADDERITPFLSSAEEAKDEESERGDFLRAEADGHMRVKAVDFHDTEPWLLTAQYSGHVVIWNYEEGSVLKIIRVCELPTRVAKFIKQQPGCLVTASDDMKIRIINYETEEIITTFEGHTDYIRSVEVHPTRPVLLTSGDDCVIKLWNLEHHCVTCLDTFDGHTHYVMQVRINPKQPNTFASACLDRSIRLWSLDNQQEDSRHHCLYGHEKGVNCLDYDPSPDRPFLVSGADDCTVKIWNYETRELVGSFSGHEHNVVAVLFHNTMSAFASASEDQVVRFWSFSADGQHGECQKEMDLKHGRCWALAAAWNTETPSVLAIGCDGGCAGIEWNQESTQRWFFLTDSSPPGPSPNLRDPRFYFCLFCFCTLAIALVYGIAEFPLPFFLGVCLALFIKVVRRWYFVGPARLWSS